MSEGVSPVMFEDGGHTRRVMELLQMSREAIKLEADSQSHEKDESIRVNDVHQYHQYS
jgi:hypothetical protein